jgi:hypothetical protein
VGAPPVPGAPPVRVPPVPGAPPVRAPPVPAAPPVRAPPVLAPPVLPLSGSTNGASTIASSPHATNALLEASEMAKAKRVECLVRNPDVPMAWTMD